MSPDAVTPVYAPSFPTAPTLAVAIATGNWQAAALCILLAAATVCYEQQDANGRQAQLHHAQQASARSAARQR